jgi:hypothetical protein
MASFKALFLAASLVLAACGGGGGDSLAGSSATPTPTTISTTSIPADTCMQAGLQIVNANGIIQIDQNYLNLEYRTKYSATGTTLTFTTPGYANEVVAVRADGAGFYVKSKSGNTWTIAASASTTITAWLFSEPTTATGNSGFEIYRGDGALAFAADKLYMKPVWSGKVPDSTASGSVYGGVINDYSVPLTSGNYAAALCGQRRAVYPNDMGAQGVWSLVKWDGVKVGSTGATVGAMFESMLPSDPSAGLGDGVGQSAGGWLTIIDVSNL